MGILAAKIFRFSLMYIFVRFILLSRDGNGTVRVRSGAGFNFCGAGRSGWTRGGVSAGWVEIFFFNQHGCGFWGNLIFP